MKLRFSLPLLIGLCAASAVFIPSCRQNQQAQNEVHTDTIKNFFEKYYDERMALFPLEATQNGDNRFNDQLPCDISVAYREKIKSFYKRYLDELSKYDRSKLSNHDQISYDILKWELETDLEGYSFDDNYMPINQFWGLPLTMAQLGSGEGNQPFKTVKDYEDFLGRMAGFATWCDTAINNMRKGEQSGQVLPKVLAERMVPQMQAMVVKDIRNYIFYQPLKHMPDSFSNDDKARLINLYETSINEKIIPSYKKLLDFIQEEYIGKCRSSAGISDVPGGKERYAYLSKYWTTTQLTPDEIFNIGEKEVSRLRGEMEKVKNETGFKGDLKAFFVYINSDKKFRPYSKPEEVLAAYHSIRERMDPQLKKLFNRVPKSKFEIRRTEKFREASASAEYNQGSPDGSRPGIFYVPVPDAAKYNVVGMESLFLHEAIPGHHYQVSLQMENTDLPSFRRFLWYGAYGEGWALYTESLGKELGLYTDPYQYFGSLSEEMHRAIRLVVDVGMHTKGWTREQAIQYSLDNESESREAITAEIERYMAIPGQALSYKIGQLKIIELRQKAEKELGNKFDIAAFHDELLSLGCIPIKVLEKEINSWIENRKK
jgi:uncharacterized protein (DUF885 family)